MERATLIGRHTTSSLQIGMISTEYVSLAFVVEFWMSCEINCSEDLALAQGVSTGATEHGEGHGLDGSDRTEELDHLERVLLGRIEEVEAVLDLLHRDGVLVGVVLEDELLEVEERPLVVDLLSHLDKRAPRVLGRQTRALRALRTLDEVLDLKNLLQNRRREDLAGYQHRCEMHTLRTSFWMVNLTRNRFECGSVQMNPASMRRTLLSPLSLRRQMARSSRDSMSQMTHCVGGARYREQPLHQLTAACLGIPSVMSILPAVSSAQGRSLARTSCADS